MYTGFSDSATGYREMQEVMVDKRIKKERQFSESDERRIEQLIANGWRREHAIEVVEDMHKKLKQWAEEREKPIDPKRLEAQKAIFRRMQNEIVAGYEED